MKSRETGFQYSIELTPIFSNIKSHETEKLPAEILVGLRSTLIYIEAYNPIFLAIGHMSVHFHREH